MNLKSKSIGLALLLTIAIGLIMTLNAAAPGSQGPYVDEQWFRIIKSPDAQLIALTTHEIDGGGVPLPEYIPNLQAADFTIGSTVRYGYNMLFTNNLLYPCDDKQMRLAFIRLMDKDALDELMAPVSEHLEYWLPESQAAWVNPNARLQLYDPLEAAAILDAAGYVEGTTPSGWYDPDVPGSVHNIRIDPDTGQDMAPFEYVTRPYAESPLYYEQSMIVNDRLHAAGLPSVLTPKAWTDIVYILINRDFEDYQVLTGVGIVWGSPSPDILYDFFESTQRPLWNVWNWIDSATDDACHAMKATLDIDEMKAAVYEIQAIANENVPYIPMMKYLAYTTETGPYDTSPGAIKIVNAAGSGSEASYNEFGKEFGEAGRVEGGKNIYKHFIGAELDTLNPLMADTTPDWQCLDLVMGDFMRLNPYTQDYQWRAIEGMPTLAEWTGPGGEAGMTLEYTLRDNVKWHDGVPVTAEDCVFALNLMRFQENERYLSTWQPIYDVKTTGTYSFKVWYLQRYIFAHEAFGISLLAPKHIWEDWIDSPGTGEPLVISTGTGPMGGDVWTSTGRHHSGFDVWDVAHPTDSSLTCLIGTDNFVYRDAGWDPGVSVYVEAWTAAENYVERINPGDCNIDQIVDMRDVWQVLYRQGVFTGQCYPGAIGGHPRWDSIADIAAPAQKIIGDEIVLVQSNFGATWGPGT